jgi:hypothetical protein
MADSFDILSDAPTLVYPNGGEFFTEGNILIQWTEPLNVPSTETVWYEIFITDKYDSYGKLDLRQIATIPYGNSSFSYYINKNLKGLTCRVGIRAVNQNGYRSKISFSADNFTITNEDLPSPSVLEPYSGGLYFSYIPIVLQHDAVMGRCSQRSFYQIFYKSESQEIDWTLIKTNIMVGSEPFDLDVRNLSTSSDYSLKIELTDEGHVSPPLFINDITINNINYFSVDTLPPKGSIQVINNNEYIKDKDIIVSLKAYDFVSGVKEYQIEETDLTSQNDVLGRWSLMTPIVSWDVGSPDGEKLIKVRYKDYGDNVIRDSSVEKYFRTYKEIDNKEITASLSYGSDFYYTFEGDPDSPSIGNPLLYKNRSLLYTLDGNATALEMYNGILYVAILDPYENKGILQRESGSSIKSVRDNSNQYVDEEETILNSLYSSDSVINTMEVFDSKLFIGIQNGNLLVFNGGTIEVANDTYSEDRSIKLIKTDGNLLYIFFENTTEILIMYKDNSGSYVFTTVETGS